MSAYLNEIVVEADKKEVAQDVVETLEKKTSAESIEERIEGNKVIISCTFGDFGNGSTTSLDEAIEVKNILFGWIISNSSKTFVLTHDVSCYLGGDYARVIYDYNEDGLIVKDWFSENTISSRRKTYNTFSFAINEKKISLLTGNDDLVYPVYSSFKEDNNDYLDDVDFQYSCIEYRVEDLYTEEVINRLIGWLSESEYHSNNKDEQIEKILEQFDIRKKDEGMNFQDFLNMIDDKLRRLETS